MLYRVQKMLVTLESFLGTLVGVHITAVPKGFNDVPETMVWYPLSAVYGLLMDEITDYSFIVAVILYFVKLNRGVVVYAWLAGWFS